jgi:nicotinamide mononucleotide (NMN) deamidase PncC
MVAALLAGVPGISENLCGSFVVYRNHSKEEWLSISRKRLKDLGEVSREIAIEMAESALKRTPEAELSVSITGHLGPLKARRGLSASNGVDGQVFVAIAHRSHGRSSKAPKTSKNSTGFGMHMLSVVQEFQLPGSYGSSKSAAKPLDLRLKRQMLASGIVLTLVRELLIA